MSNDDMFVMDQMRRAKTGFDRLPLWQKALNVATVAGVESVWRNICGFAVALYSCLVISYAWLWFVIPVFPSLPVLGVIQIWALKFFSVSMGLYTPFRFDRKTPDNATWLEKWYRIFDSVIVWSMAWLLLFVAHLIMQHWL